MANVSRHFRGKLFFGSVHEKIRPFQCKLCKKSFAVKKSLIGHIQRVHDGEFMKDFKERTGHDAQSIIKNSIVEEEVHEEVALEDVYEEIAMESVHQEVLFSNQGVFTEHVHEEIQMGKYQEL